MMFDGVAVSATTATADATHTDTASHTTASVSVAHTDTTTAAATTTAETSKTTSGTTAVNIQFNVFCIQHNNTGHQ
jgi:hypothetical protein